MLVGYQARPATQADLAIIVALRNASSQDTRGTNVTADHWQMRHWLESAINLATDSLWCWHQTEWPWPTARSSLNSLTSPIASLAWFTQIFAGRVSVHSWCSGPKSEPGKRPRKPRLAAASLSIVPCSTVTNTAWRSCKHMALSRRATSSIRKRDSSWP